MQFGDLELTPYLQRGDSQDIGTGNAMTNFMQLPGGGYYDNYRERKSPQGPRPLTKSCVIIGTAEELREQLDAFRRKIGNREKLTVEFDDGQSRWQWARLQNVGAPRSEEMKGGWLPVALTWLTASQNWRGVQHLPNGWKWGDGTWLFGDGTAKFGVGAQVFTMVQADSTFNVVHDGNTDATNVTLRFEISGSWQDMTIINETNGCVIKLTRTAKDSTPLLEINAGARSMYLGDDPDTIAEVHRDVFTSAENRLYVRVTGAHGLVTGDIVRIEGTGIYDDDYYPVLVVDYARIEVPFASHLTAYGSVTTGTLRKLRNVYGSAAFSDKNRWFVLSPGNNTVRVLWSPSVPSTVLRVGYDDHYA